MIAILDRPGDGLYLLIRSYALSREARAKLIVLGAPRSPAVAERIPRLLGPTLLGFVPTDSDEVSSVRVLRAHGKILAREWPRRSYAVIGVEGVGQVLISWAQGVGNRICSDGVSRAWVDEVLAALRPDVAVLGGCREPRARGSLVAPGASALGNVLVIGERLLACNIFTGKCAELLPSGVQPFKGPLR
ncbi:MAG: hypothetical protein ABWK00_05295 [Desulfurococcaceae archaeon]